MASNTEICNIALTALWAEQINDINEGSKNSKICLTRYATVRDAVLRMHPWNSAMRRFSLPAVGDKPAFGARYAYNLPADPFCLRVYKLLDKRARWTVEGRRILTDAAPPLRGWYIGRISEADMDALLVEAIGAKLANAIAGRIRASTAAVQEARSAFNETMREARSVDAMEGSPEEQDESSILEARY